MITEKDYKNSLKQIVKSDKIDDLLLILKYNKDEKIKVLLTDPNNQNLLMHKTELALWQNMIETFEWYKDHPQNI